LQVKLAVSGGIGVSAIPWLKQTLKVSVGDLAGQMADALYPCGQIAKRMEARERSGGSD
jgi:hypothetical protein